jgi:hypothetical protein
MVMPGGCSILHPVPINSDPGVDDAGAIKADEEIGGGYWYGEFTPEGHEICYSFPDDDDNELLGEETDDEG